MSSTLKRRLLLIARRVGLRLFARGFFRVHVELAACALILLQLGLLAGCAGLPQQVHRPVSHAIAPHSADTHLARVAASSLTEDAGRLSGLRLLPLGDEALEARIALARAAAATIDAQYYQIADDASGRQFLRELRDAAARGVRVRILIDDLHAGGQDALLAGLAARPNVELRMFNPLRVREGSVRSRVLLSLHEFARINRRMHNKLFVTDNAFAISGGRNIADEYFGRSGPANFIDMDVLSAGPVVQQLSAVFDRYWNSEQAYPIESIVAPGSVQDAMRFFDEAMRRPGTNEPASTERPLLDPKSIEAQISQGRIDLQPAAVRVIADGPRKAEAATATLADGEVMDENLLLVRNAREEVLMASPYFVPGHRTLQTLEAATQRNVQVSLMTNSLATTDEPLAHFGYARHRNALLRMGVALYELMPGNRDAPSIEGAHSSAGRLHAKLAVVDRRWVSIGSMNMDRRSAHCNTEIGLIIDSPELAEQVASLLRRERLPNSYRVLRAADGQDMQWIAQHGDEQLVYPIEPTSTWILQLRMSILTMLIDEEWL